MPHLTTRASPHPYSEAPKGRCNPRDKHPKDKPVASPADIHDLNNLIMAAQMATTTPNRTQFIRCIDSVVDRIDKICLRY